MKKYNEIFEGAYIREREEDGKQFILLSEAAFSTISWNCNSLEDDGIILTQSDEDEKIWTISDGKETINLKVEKQIHQKVDKTWKIDGEKMSDGTTIKLNGTYKGDFEVWSNSTINSKGRRAWKRLSVHKSEDSGRKALKKAIKEYKNTLKPEVEKKEA